MPYRVLSFDGGGIRGVFTARLLAHLDERLPGALARADLLAGTSTGSFLALGLAAGLSPGRLVELYEQLGPRVFRAGALRTVADLDGLLAARYSQEALRVGLEQAFAEAGVRRLSDLPRRVLVPAFDLDGGADPRHEGRRHTWKPKFFHNFPGPDSDGDGDEEIVAVALRSSAAPCFFPSAGRFIDGGVAANNPAMAALAQALDPALGGQAIADMRLLSLGTGFTPHLVRGENLRWGLVEWAPHLLDLALDGDTDVVDYQCRQVLGSADRRLNAALPAPIGLDDAGQIGQLLALADELAAGPAFAESARWLEREWA